ncbi:carbonic anhydrase 6-like [Anoplophora glabripennis]|uniref:carbonic anhydrase 6-like n=1 Tax=Anoplophora glabripennis TaxID=217634 RepID=UPI000C755FB5|nr:carbonic anhydrase 6-like [Anoplophora glabripennis]
MVFYSEKYNNFNDAANQADGLTVLSFLYQATNEENGNYKQFENNLPKVHNLSSYTAIKNFVSLTEFTINNKNVYFTYKGSLTTPPCSEVVTWIEFKNTIPLSHEQIQAFRLLAGQGGQLTHNFRPVQLLYDRVIYMNSPSHIFRIDNTFMIINALVSLIYCNITK